MTRLRVAALLGGTAALAMWVGVYFLVCLKYWTADDVWRPEYWTVVGFAVGCVLAHRYRHPYRILGVAGWAGLIGAIAIGFVPAWGWDGWVGGLIAVPLGMAVRGFAQHLRRSAWWRPGAVQYALWFVPDLAVLGGFVLLVNLAPDDGRCRDWLEAACWLAGVAVAVVCVAFLLRPMVEAASEMMFRPVYVITAEWLGYSVTFTDGRTTTLDMFPPAGPVLVVANHACWLDPLFVGKHLPRPFTAMMTETFYRIWFLKPLLKYVFRVIVVPHAAVRKAAPEIDQAIAALDAGRVVLIFPEAYLRRTEEQVVRRFGRGVWQILSARPDTPVVCCWIDGNWGSYTSYFNGPPTVNKQWDVRRPIRVGFGPAEPVPAGVLADHLPARVYLMNRVLAVRETMGLPPVPAVELPAKGDDQS